MTRLNVWARWLAPWGVSGVVGAVMYGLYVQALIRLGVRTDVQAHLAQIARWRSGEAAGLPANSLFYQAVYELSGGTPDVAGMLTAACLVLALAWAAKAAITWYLLGYLSGGVPRTVGGLIALTGLALVLQGIYTPHVHPVYRTYGLLLPNVWHNSTTVVLAPMALGAWWVFVVMLREGWAISRVLLLTGLLVLGAWAKPSFLFCFLPVYGVAVLACRVPWQRWGWAALPALAGLGMILWQHEVTFRLNTGALYEAPSRIILDPGRAWVHFAQGAGYVWPNLAVSLGGVVMGGFLLPQARRRAPEVLAAVALLAVGMALFYLLYEQGPRQYHANFVWQAHLALMILWVTLTGQALGWAREVFASASPTRVDWARLMVMGAVLLVYLWAGWRFYAGVLWEGRYA